MRALVLLVAIMVCCALGLVAQQAGSYTITKLVDYDESKLIVALDKCRFDNYRKLDERVTLTFENGTTVELLSVNEMQLQGLACDTKIVTPSGHVQKNVFQLHPDGYIMEVVRKDKNSNDRKLEMVEDAKKAQP